MIFLCIAWTLMITICIAAVVFMQIMQRYKSLKQLPGLPPSIFVIYRNISSFVNIYRKSKILKYHPAVYITERIIGGAVLHRSHGIYCFWFGLTPIVVIFKAEAAEIVLSSNVSIEKSHEYTFLQKWLGTGLLTRDLRNFNKYLESYENLKLHHFCTGDGDFKSTGEKWKTRRKLLTPSFHFRILEDFLPVFNQQSLELVKKLEAESEKEYIDIAPLIILCTLDVICETVMGVSIGAQKGNNSDYVQAIHNLADFFNQRNVRPWLWTDFLFNLTSMGRSYNRDIDILHNFTDKVIKEKKEKILSGANLCDSTGIKEQSEYCVKQRKTFMDLLLDMHIKERQLSEADIREEVDTFMFEGHDTTAMGIIFALYCIGLYPEVQKKIIEELDGIFEGDIDRPVTYDDVRNMKYLECALKESQRLYPSVPIIGRKLDEDIYFEGLKVPKNTMLHFNMLGLHRDPKVFPNPEVFDPERFLPENSLNRHPYAYVPFSAGPRNCIGQKFAMLEEKTVVCNILRHFKIISLDPRDKFHVKVEFTLRPAQEVRLKFMPRN